MHDYLVLDGFQRGSLYDSSSQVHNYVFAGLASGSSRDSFDVCVPKVIRVSALYLSTVAVASSMKYTPLGCSPTRLIHDHSYMIEFPHSNVNTCRSCSLISVTAACGGRGCDCKRMYMYMA